MRVRTRAWMVIAGLGAGFGLAWTGWPLHLPTTCPFRLITGMPCGACGLTHAFCTLAHGDVRGAMDYHVGVLPLAAVFAAVGVMAAAELVSGERVMGKVWLRGKRVWVSGAVALFVVGWTVNLVKFWGG